MASDSRSPAVPAGGPSPASLGARRGAPRRASGPGSGAESPSSRDTGRGRKGGRPLARHAPHVRGEPGAKPFVDDLLLGRGFVRSRAAPSLRSIESQPSTQGFVAPACRPAGRRGRGVVVVRATLSLFSLRGLCLSPGRPAGRRPPRSGGCARGSRREGEDGGAPDGASRPRGAAPSSASPPRALARGLGRGMGGRGVARMRVRGRRRAAPPSPFPGGTSGAGGLVARACRGRHLRVRTCPFPLVPAAGRGEGR